MWIFQEMAAFSDGELPCYRLPDTTRRGFPAPVGQKKRRPKRTPLSYANRLSALAHLGEALAAVNGTVRLRLKGNLGLAAAGSANSGEELAGATSGVLASVTAGLAALGLVLEAALSVELLLTGGEHELIATLFAN